VIQADNLCKNFHDRKKGTIHAVKDISFVCHPGEIFALLGPNGAGKTTTLRLLSTAITPSSGSGTILGHDISTSPEKVRKNIGFLAANSGLYGRLTPEEIFKYFGQLFSMPRQKIKDRIEELNELFDLSEILKRPCDKLSTGMKQRVNIARSIFHDPEVIILDEPTAGLDVISSRNIIEFINQCRENQKTVLLSTHIMSEVQRLADRVGIIHQGELKFYGTLSMLREQFGDNLEDAFITIVTENSN
jgi:sodium transport system ATP-binding protein